MPVRNHIIESAGAFGAPAARRGASGAQANDAREPDGAARDQAKEGQLAAYFLSIWVSCTVSPL